MRSQALASLLGSVVLAGGTSLIRGLPQRLASELGDYSARNSPRLPEIRVLEPMDDVVWRGAAVLARVGDLERSWCAGAGMGA